MFLYEVCRVFLEIYGCKYEKKGKFELIFLLFYLLNNSYFEIIDVRVNKSINELIRILCGSV